MSLDVQASKAPVAEDPMTATADQIVCDAQKGFVSGAAGTRMEGVGMGFSWVEGARGAGCEEVWGVAPSATAALSSRSTRAIQPLPNFVNVLSPRRKARRAAQSAWMRSAAGIAPI